MKAISINADKSKNIILSKASELFLCILTYVVK